MIKYLIGAVIISFVGAVGVYYYQINHQLLPVSNNAPAKVSIQTPVSDTVIPASSNEKVALDLAHNEVVRELSSDAVSYYASFLRQENSSSVYKVAFDKIAHTPADFWLLIEVNIASGTIVDFRRVAYPIP